MKYATNNPSQLGESSRTTSEAVRFHRELTVDRFQLYCHGMFMISNISKLCLLFYRTTEVPHSTFLITKLNSLTLNSIIKIWGLLKLKARTCFLASLKAIVKEMIEENLKNIIVLHLCNISQTKLLLNSNVVSINYGISKYFLLN